MKMQTLALAFLAATAIGGVAWVFLYPILSGERKAESRRASVARAEPAARHTEKGQRSRREQVEGSLKDLEARRKKESKLQQVTREAAFSMLPVAVEAVVGVWALPSPVHAAKRYR